MGAYVALKPIYTPFSINVVFPDEQSASFPRHYWAPIPSGIQDFELSADNKPNGPSLL